MSNSLVKFTSRKDGNGRGELFWGRADIDGLPFRGHNPPSMRQDEFEERVVRVADPKNGTFYTGDDEENAAFLKVMDGITNSWYHMIFIERWREEGDKHHYVYVEWVEFFLEDGKPTPYAPPSSTGM
jgi:hypothetical protein